MILIRGTKSRKCSSSSCWRNLSNKIFVVLDFLSADLASKGEDAVTKAIKWSRNLADELDVSLSGSPQTRMYKAVP